jgi:drug/metabolite transporter (DMT)-like permease
VSATHAPYHRPVLGVLFKLTSVLFLASMGACVKYLGDAIPSGETIFVRGIISIVVLALVAWRVEGGLHVLKTRNLRSHALRSLSGTASMFCWFTALTLIPLADFTAISFTAPLFLTILAMLFLGERIHGYRWSALGIGFVGVLIMVGPQLTFGSSAGVAVALGAAVFSAVAVTTLRSMSGSGGEHAITITFYFSVTNLVCSTFTALAGWPMPTAKQWLFMGLAGLLGVLGQLLMTYSYRYAEASTVAPLDYANLLFAVLYGYYFFGELPHLSTWIGAPLVIAAGAIILWREYRLAVPRPASPVSPSV